MINWAFIGILFAVAMVCCSIGFKNYVWFMSIGYGFAVAGIGVASIILWKDLIFTNFGIGSAIVLGQLIMFIVYGFRLGGFLAIREWKNKDYKKTLKEASGKEPPIFVKVFMWLFMGVLYVAQTSPVHFRLENFSQITGADLNTSYILPLIGLIIMIFAVCLESLADKQKSAQKKVRPDMVAKDGLYKFVRCPNYFGEILFWTGIFISGIPFMGVAQWIIAVLAYIAIVYIMFNGAERLEKRQSKRYGQNKEYVDYANTTPIIIPLLPIYHLYDPKKDAEKEAKKAQKK